MSTRIVSVAFVCASLGQLHGAPLVHASESEPCCGGASLIQSPRPGHANGPPGILAWAGGVPGGGVRSPRGVVCTAWRHAADINEEVGPMDLYTVGVDADGVRRNLYFRDCGTQRQQVWVRAENPSTLAGIALSDIQRRLIAAPVPVLSPPGIGYVNLETWLATVDPGTHTATAAIPGLSVTATATLVSTTWTTGDGGKVTCDGTGAAWTPERPAEEPAPCGHTYTTHGAAIYASEPFTITVSQTWHVTWRASTGAAGELGTITGPTATINYEVREIQTIGVQG